MFKNGIVQLGLGLPDQQNGIQASSPTHHQLTDPPTRNFLYQLKVISIFFKANLGETNFCGPYFIGNKILLVPKHIFMGPQYVFYVIINESLQVYIGQQWINVSYNRPKKLKIAKN